MLSNPQEVYVGLTQRKVLSPVLYSFYMSDILEAIKSAVEDLIYADMYVYCCGPSLNGVLQKLEGHPRHRSLVNVL